MLYPGHQTCKGPVTDSQSAGRPNSSALFDDGMLKVVGGGDAREMDRESWGVPSNGRPAFTSLEQLLSYEVRGKPRAVFTRLAMGTNRALNGELGCFEMPLVPGTRLQLGRFDPDTDVPARQDKIVLSMADRRGLSRCHGSLECRDGRCLVVWPVTEKEGFPTWVNGEPVGSCTKLRSGDWLGFGAISGRPVLAFDVQICASVHDNMDSAARVLKPKTNPGAPDPAKFGLEGRSISASPASDNELSTDWTPKPDDEGRDKRPSRSSQSTVLERAQRQLAQTNAQSNVLERAQRQLGEMKLELQEKAAADEKERSARRTMSNEAAELRGEIAALRGSLADKAADQVFLNDPSGELEATPPHARSQSSRDANDLSGSDPAAASPLRRSLNPFPLSVVLPSTRRGGGVRRC